MNVNEALREARETIATYYPDEAALEAELLLRQALGLSRVAFYQDRNRNLSARESAAFQYLVRRRLTGEPVAYITGEREFYGLSFYVDRNVLIPRPETELMVTAALERAARRPTSAIADVGTGCGAIAIALAESLPQARIYATDISEAALSVAQYNCRRHGVSHRVHLLLGDLARPLPEPVDLLMANLPYVPDGEVDDNHLAAYEPELALRGGWDGLEVIRRLLTTLDNYLRPGGTLLLEVGMGQAQIVAGLLADCYPQSEVTITPDLAGIDRVVGLHLQEKPAAIPV
jgi:release factor glutamine methyltransferase